MRRVSRAFALLAALPFLLAACGNDDLALGARGSGDIVRKTVEVEAFDRIDVRNAFQVTLQDGPHGAVLEIDDNLVDLVDVSTRNGRFNLGLETDDTPRGETLGVTITVPAVAEIRASGAVRVDVADPIPVPEDLEIRVSGASRLEGKFEAAVVEANVSDASQLQLTVTTDQIEVDASGATDVEFTGSADELELELSGASLADLRDWVSPPRCPDTSSSVRFDNSNARDLIHACTRGAPKPCAPTTCGSSTWSSIRTRLPSAWRRFARSSSPVAGASSSRAVAPPPSWDRSQTSY